MTVTNNVELGEYTTGQRFARLRLQRDGITAMIEGVGDTSSDAVEAVFLKLRELAEVASEAAEAMDV